MHHFLVKTVLPAFCEAIFLNYKSHHFMKFHLSFFGEMLCSEAIWLNLDAGLLDVRDRTAAGTCAREDMRGLHAAWQCLVKISIDFSSNKHWQTAKDQLRIRFGMTDIEQSMRLVGLASNFATESRHVGHNWDQWPCFLLPKSIQT